MTTSKNRGDRPWTDADMARLAADFQKVIGPRRSFAEYWGLKDPSPDPRPPRDPNARPYLEQCLIDMRAKDEAAGFKVSDGVFHKPKPGRPVNHLMNLSRYLTLRSAKPASGT